MTYAIITTRKSKQEGKNQKSIQSNTTPDQDTILESDKTQENMIYKRTKRSFLSQQDHMDARNRKYSMTDKHETQITKKIHKNNRLGKVSKKVTGVLNHI